MDQDRETGLSLVLRGAGRWIILLPLLVWLVMSGSSLAAAQALTPDDKLCISCHTRRPGAQPHEKGEEEGKCLKCHTPHSVGGGTLVPTPEKKQCTLCHFEFSDARKKDLEKNKLLVSRHAPADAGECLSCHTEHDLNSQPGYRVEKNLLCSTCHTTGKGDTYKHDPVAKGFCTDCHDPHFSKNEHLLTVVPNKLCVTCHNRAKDNAQPVQHPPFSQGQCTSCHDPHGSKYPSQLKAAVPDLCYTCHKGPGAELKKLVQHQPFAAGQCIECHSPHASGTARLLTTPKQQDLCYKCHATIKADFAATSHHPVGEKLECSGCHVPHAGDVGKLLRGGGNALCFGCHADKGDYYPTIAHGKVDLGAGKGACVNCHTPHGSKNQPLLKKEEISLCKTCHTNGMYNGMSAHPVGGGYISPSNGRPLVCGSCHDPHGAGFAHMLRKKGDGLCLTCHQDKGK
ncbi:MAG: cytochrome c3 family protein [Firmicutes bacterium]|nr:cytochrome c3 family protein [Bacillota bacterium]MCL5040758.1 cytochrome c3 family protein [Bacillota bacterium]